MTRGLYHYNSQYLYRVLRPDEDPKQDIRCLAPDSTRGISEHVESGLHIPSRFISTSTSKECALEWIVKADRGTSHIYKNRRNVIVKIDIYLLKTKFPKTIANAIDLSIIKNREAFLETTQQKQFSISTNEVLFQDFIPSEAISIEYIKNNTTESRVKRKRSQVGSDNIAPPSKTIKLDNPNVVKNDDLVPNIILSKNNEEPVHDTKRAEVKTIPELKAYKQTLITSFFTHTRSKRKEEAKSASGETEDDWMRSRNHESLSFPEPKTCHSLDQCQIADLPNLFSSVQSTSKTDTFQSSTGLKLPL